MIATSPNNQFGKLLYIYVYIYVCVCVREREEIVYIM